MTLSLCVPVSRNEANLPHLLNVAPRARNAFDRYHANPFPSTAEAAEYLAAYASNAVRGFTDMLILPAPDSTEPSAFLTGAFDHCHEKACGNEKCTHLAHRN